MYLPFSLTTYDERVARTRGAIRDQELDGIVITLPDAITWLTGFDTIGYLWAQSLLVDLTEEEPVLHTRTTEMPGALASCWLRSPVFYDIAKVDPVQILVQTLRDRGLANGRLGIDLRSFTFLPAQWDALKQLLPEATFVDTTDLVAELRVVKSPEEIAFQRQAAEMADHALMTAIEALRPGVSETAIAGIAAQALGEAGSEYAAIPPMVVSGPRSALVHAMAGRRTISRGDVVCLELGASVNRYHAIVMRTAVVGASSQRVADVHACTREGYLAAVEASRPGAAAHEPDDACNAVLERMDLVRRRCHRIGYSIGVAYPPGWLEPMMLVEGDPHVLTPGMSFSLEPNLSLHDEGFGIKLGDTVLCTADGPERLSKIEPDLFEV